MEGEFVATNAEDSLVPRRRNDTRLPKRIVNIELEADHSPNERCALEYALSNGDENGVHLLLPVASLVKVGEHSLECALVENEADPAVAALDVARDDAPARTKSPVS